MNKISVLFYGVEAPVLNHEYIVGGILREYEISECEMIQVGQEENINKVYDVLVYNCSDPNRLSYGGFPPSYTQIKQAIIKLRPKLVIQLADEWAIEHNEIHNLLANYCNLFLRQHRHSSQIEFYPKNLYAIPLGYLNGYTSDTSIVKPMKERKHTWSWVGNFKLDRIEMITTFWSMWNNIVATNPSLSRQDIYNIYSDSVFVPCGRGNSSLDCWRLYEATVAGAIPVVVGPDEEIDYTFKFFGKIPPWIYAPTWEAAVKKAQEVQFDFKKLQQMQLMNISWWESLMGCMRIEISEALVSDRPDISQVNLEKQESSMPQPVSAVSYC